MINDFQEIEEKPWNKLNATREDNEWYYRSMFASFESAPNSLIGTPILNQFKNAVEILFGLT